jgi:hypothetical protein
MALLLVLAGCTGQPSAPDDESPTDSASPGTTSPPATDTSGGTTRTATPTPGAGTATPAEENDTVVVENVELPVNATRIYERVERIVGAEAPAPTVRTSDKYSLALPTRAPFARQVGLAIPDAVREDGPEANLPIQGLVLDGSVVLFPTSDGTSVEDAPAGVVERLLVHEFVHVIQSHRGALQRLEGLPEQVRTGVREGGAVYVTTVYDERYGLDTLSGRTPLADRRAWYEANEPYARMVAGTYYLGGRYFARTVEDPTNIWSVYEDPPTTTARILHPDRTAGASSLPVDSAGASASLEHRGTRGELFVRTALETQVPREEAAAAAEGWANDSVVRYRSGGAQAFAWVVRTTDESEADELAGTFETYASARSNETVTARVERVGPDTVVLLLGDAAAASALTVDASGGTVTVTASDGATLDVGNRPVASNVT